MTVAIDEPDEVEVKVALGVEVKVALGTDAPVASSASAVKSRRSPTTRRVADGETEIDATEASCPPVPPEKEQETSKAKAWRETT